MIFTPHKDYSLMLPAVEMVRDCIEGEPIVKSKRLTYLKHPNMIDQTSDTQLARYNAYIDGAEFDEFAGNTEQEILGQMTKGEFVFDFPESLQYLEQNSDGDGMSLKGAIEYTYKNALEVKFHILLAEFQGLADVEASEVTVADVKRLNPRATIKHYVRESLIDWDFRRINGVMQISLLIFMEKSCERDSSTFTTKEITSYLVLALDDDGKYYQQKYVTGADGGAQQDGEPVYPMVGGKKLNWIPVEIVADSEIPSGKLPTGLGYLSRSCYAALYRYRASADYKEALRMMQPTLFSSGWTEGGKELFQELNDRDHIAFGIGSPNAVPDGVTVEVVGLDAQTEPFIQYFDLNSKKARSLGASFDDGSSDNGSNETAKAVGIENSKRNAIMESVANNVEAAFNRMVSYCAMFNGLWSPDQVEAKLDSFTLTVPRNFGESRISAQEVAEIRNNVQASIISKDEGLRQLAAGGWTIEEAETIMSEIASQGPTLGLDGNPLEDENDVEDDSGTVIANEDQSE